METERDGKPVPPVVLLEMPEFRFGAFEAIGCAARELAGKDPRWRCRWTSAPLGRSWSWG